MVGLLVADTAFDAAVSLAVSAGINASDALILHATGSIPTGSGHEEAVRLLRRAGHSTAASQLQRLLSVKSVAQYSARRCSSEEADQALQRGERLIDLARKSWGMVDT